MQETFYQYNLKTELAKKYSHSTYLASPTNESERQVILTVFASSLFHFPHEHEKFLKKARRVKKLQHPRLASLLDMGVEQGQPFIVREYLPNGSLRSRLKKLSPHHLELGKALSIVSQVGQALAYAHEHGIIHGNIKPENILLDASGQAILTDFNLVSRNDAIIRDQVTEEYAFCYLAPEQFSGISHAKSDQYALGCLAYELITGRLPFAAQSLASIMEQHRTTDPIPLSDGNVDLPPTLEVAVLKALSNDPEERFDDFLLFLEVIQSVLSPSPTFPLTRSTNSRDTKTASPATPSAIAQIAVSPIRKRAARRSVPEVFEPSGALSSTEIDVAEPVAITSPLSLAELVGSPPISEPLVSVLPSSQFTAPFSGDKELADDGENDHPSQLLEEHKLNTSSATMPEAIPLSEDSLSGLAMTTLIAEQETGDSLLTDIFMPQEEDGTSVIASLGSLGYAQSEYEVDQMISSLIEGSDETVSVSVPTQDSKRRSIGRFLLLSLLVGLIVYASVVMGLWTTSILRPSGTVKPDTHSYVATEVPQAGATQTVSNRTSVSSYVPHTSVSKMQSVSDQSTPSAQPTDTPTVQPTASATSTNSPPTSGGFWGGGGGFWGGGWGGGR